MHKCSKFLRSVRRLCEKVVRGRPQELLSELTMQLNTNFSAPKISNFSNSGECSHVPSRPSWLFALIKISGSKTFGLQELPEKCIFLSFASLFLLKDLNSRWWMRWEAYWKWPYPPSWYSSPSSSPSSSPQVLASQEFFTAVSEIWVSIPIVKFPKRNPPLKLY